MPPADSKLWPVLNLICIGGYALHLYENGITRADIIGAPIVGALAWIFRHRLWVKRDEMTATNPTTTNYVVMWVVIVLGVALGMWTAAAGAK